jgi:hypothetical protein
MKFDIETAKRYWSELGNVPVNKDDDIDEDFIVDNRVVFHKGTDKIEIWHWFEETFNISVAKELMNLK